MNRRKQGYVLVLVLIVTLLLTSVASLIAASTYRNIEGSGASLAALSQQTAADAKLERYVAQLATRPSLSFPFDRDTLSWDADKVENTLRYVLLNPASTSLPESIPAIAADEEITKPWGLVLSVSVMDHDAAARTIRFTVHARTVQVEGEAAGQTQLRATYSVLLTYPELKTLGEEETNFPISIVEDSCTGFEYV